MYSPDVWGIRNPRRCTKLVCFHAYNLSPHFYFYTYLFIIYKCKSYFTIGSAIAFIFQHHAITCKITKLVYSLLSVSNIDEYQGINRCRNWCNYHPLPITLVGWFPWTFVPPWNPPPQPQIKKEKEREDVYDYQLCVMTQFTYQMGKFQLWCDELSILDYQHYFICWISTIFVHLWPLWF